MRDQNNRTAKRYWVFVSYSSKDRKWGKWLHSRLESYPIPRSLQGMEVFEGALLGKNLRPCFRDREELTGASDLGPAIRRALSNSHCLVVLCSKNSAKSTWVNKEIEDFRALGGGRRILALILDGVPNATNLPDVSDREECFPPALRYPHEPLAGDLREDGDGKERGFLKILAGAAQLDFDVLYKRHERAQRKRRILLGGIALGVIASLTTLSIYAVSKEREAARNAEAERLAKEEGLRELAVSTITQAYQAISGGQPLNALRALAQTPSSARNDWEWQLMKALNGPVPLRVRPEDIALLDAGPLKGSGLLEDARRLLTQSSANHLYAKTTDVLATSTGGGRGGGIISIEHASNGTSLGYYGMASYEAARNIIFSSDESCLLALTPPLSTEVITLGTGDGIGPSKLFVYVLPIPTNIVGTRKDLGLTEDDGEDSSGNEFIIEGKGDQLVISGMSNESILVRPTPAGPPAIRRVPRLDGYDSLPAGFRVALHHVPPARQRETLRNFSGDPAIFHDPEMPGERRLLSFREIPGESRVLLYVPENKHFEIGPIDQLAARQIIPLANPRAEEIWTADAEIQGTYTAGGDFSADGRILLCPWIDDRAAVLNGPTDAAPILLNDEFAYARDQSARPGFCDWILSPDGNFVGMTVFDAPSSQYDQAAWDSRTGEIRWKLERSRVTSIEWSENPSRFSFYDELNGTLSLLDQPGGNLLAEIPTNIYPQGKLVQNHPGGQDLVIVNNTLLRQSGMRPLAVFPDGFYLSDDWSVFAARFESLESTTLEAIHHVVHLGDDTTHRQSSRLLEFEITHLAGAPENNQIAAALSTLSETPEHQEQVLLARMGFLGDIQFLQLDRSARDEAARQLAATTAVPADPAAALILALYQDKPLDPATAVALSARLTNGWPGFGNFETSLEPMVMLALGQRLLDQRSGDLDAAIAASLSTDFHRHILLERLGRAPRALPFLVLEDEEKGWLGEDNVLSSLLAAAICWRDDRREESLHWLLRIREKGDRRQSAHLESMMRDPSTAESNWWHALLTPSLTNAFRQAVEAAGTSAEPYQESVLLAAVKREKATMRTLTPADISSPALLSHQWFEAKYDEENPYPAKPTEYLEALATANPGDPLVCLKLAEEAKEAGNEESRLQWLEESLKRSRTTGVQVDLGVDDDPLNQLISNAIAQDRLDEAIKLLDSAGDQPHNRFRLRMLAYIHLQRKDTPQALAAILEYLRKVTADTTDAEAEMFRTGVLLARDLMDRNSRDMLLRQARISGAEWLANEETGDLARDGMITLITGLLDDDRMEDAYTLSRIGWSGKADRTVVYLPSLAVSAWHLNARQQAVSWIGTLQPETRDVLRNSKLIPERFLQLMDEITRLAREFDVVEDE
jgi:tetratricopeptide (TPR) repeat protein